MRTNATKEMNVFGRYLANVQANFRIPWSSHRLMNTKTCGRRQAGGGKQLGRSKILASKKVGQRRGMVEPKLLGGKLRTKRMGCTRCRSSTTSAPQYSESDDGGGTASPVPVVT